MGDYEQMAWAERTLAAADQGVFDAQLGITPETRTTLNKVEAGEQLSAFDLAALKQTHRDELIVQAHNNGQFADLFNNKE